MLYLCVCSVWLLPLPLMPACIRGTMLYLCVCSVWSLPLLLMMASIRGTMLYLICLGLVSGYFPCC